MSLPSPPSIPVPLAIVFLLLSSSLVHSHVSLLRSSLFLFQFFVRFHSDIPPEGDVLDRVSTADRLLCPGNPTLLPQQVDQSSLPSSLPSPKWQSSLQPDTKHCFYYVLIQKRPHIRVRLITPNHIPFPSISNLSLDTYKHPHHQHHHVSTDCTTCSLDAFIPLQWPIQIS